MHDPVDFIRANTELGRATLVPEIALHLARHAQQIFQTAEEFERPLEQRFRPYWAFAWPGGQATARYLIDNPSLVEGRRVADIGAGSGIAAIAAAQSGARSVLAVDVDPVSASAISLNAARNGVASAIVVSTDDCLAGTLDVDLVLLSDLVYEPELALRVGAFLDRAARADVPVIVGDRLSARRPARGFVEVARYAAPLTPALHDGDAEQGRIWQRCPHREAVPRRDRGRTLS
ncbi:MAG: 50S ribosomal protein L11 methyltransferase [Hyphomicrobiaceae bacterium]